MDITNEGITFIRVIIFSEVEDSLKTIITVSCRGSFRFETFILIRWQRDWLHVKFVC